jgi:NADH dehydrogenase FAD-containing subunit
VLRDRAALVEPDSVTLGSGQVISADYIVLASGSAYPYPAKMPGHASADARAQLRDTRDQLGRADSVLLLGAGPVGLELAGEITAAWPDKRVSIVDPLEDVLSGGFVPAGYDPALRAELRRQLSDRGIELLLATSLQSPPPTEPGITAPFMVTTGDGRRIEADIWFRCFGVAPQASYLSDSLAPARQPIGHLTVTPQLRLPGQDRIFAIGDLTALAEPKTAKAAGLHAEIVAANITALQNGDAKLSTYQPGPPGIVVPLGPSGGASYSAEHGVLGAETTAQIKGADLMIDRFAQQLGINPTHPAAVA